ncbi:MAG: PD40 domain-containing protein [Chloroflexi bacterium]|nr:PD40 domain-containing protein [Chloroflexota bacterium]
MLPRISVLLVAPLALFACAGRSTTPTPSPPGPSIEPSAEAIPTETLPPPATPTTRSGPAGLVFSAAGALWQIRPDGSAANLAACAQGAALSPDGTQMLYAAQDYDIWLLDLPSCARQNLTNTPDVVELNPQWWPNLPGAILLGVNPEFDTGKPALLQLGRAGYQVFDDEASPGDLPAISPDGQSVAYAAPGGTAVIFRLTGVRQALDLTPYGLDPAEFRRLDSPSWSPDGRRLAWMAGTQQGEDYATWRIQLLILDLETKTGVRLHPYVPLGRGGWPPAPVWSPDGRWLAFNPWSEDPTQSGIWVVAADGTEEHFLTVPNPQGVWLNQLTPPVWSPDGTRLAFSLAQDLPTFWWAEIGVWQPQALPLPTDALLIAWR